MFELNIKLGMLLTTEASVRKAVDRAENTVNQYNATFFQPAVSKTSTQYSVTIEATFETMDRQLADHIRSVYERISRDYSAFLVDASVRKMSAAQGYAQQLEIKSPILLIEDVPLVPNIPVSLADFIQIPSVFAISGTEATIAESSGSSLNATLKPKWQLSDDWTLSFELDATGEMSAEFYIQSADKRSNILIVKKEDAGTTKVEMSGMGNASNMGTSNKTITTQSPTSIILIKLGGNLSTFMMVDGAWQKGLSTANFPNLEEFNLSFNALGMNGTCKIANLKIT